MLVIPAVDILGGKCVRLYRGDPNKNKIYYEDPLEAAKLLEKQGAQLIHIIDLDWFLLEILKLVWNLYP